MKSGSWASYVAAGALGDGGGPDDDDRAPSTDAGPSPIEDLQSLGYRLYREAFPDGRWIVARWDTVAKPPAGEVLGGGRNAIEAWDDAWRRFHGRPAADYGAEPEF